VLRSSVVGRRGSRIAAPLIDRRDGRLTPMTDDRLRPVP
jgi:hypothetical protein